MAGPASSEDKCVLRNILFRQDRVSKQAVRQAFFMRNLYIVSI